jgi:tetratricopeptide (TPR) repeat protein
MNRYASPHAAETTALEAAPNAAVEAPKTEEAKTPPAKVEPPAPAAEAPKAEPTTATADPQKAEPPTPEATATAPKAEPAAEGDKPAKTALQEKNDSRRSLEMGKTAAAIEAGERSVALDPTDGEAWLILGAAYQEKGQIGEARRAFLACVKQGKRGPIGECQAMLR